VASPNEEGRTRSAGCVTGGFRWGRTVELRITLRTHGGTMRNPRWLEGLETYRTAARCGAKRWRRSERCPAREARRAMSYSRRRVTRRANRRPKRQRRYPFFHAGGTPARDLMHVPLPSHAPRLRSCLSNDAQEREGAGGGRPLGGVFCTRRANSFMRSQGAIARVGRGPQRDGFRSPSTRATTYCGDRKPNGGFGAVKIPRAVACGVT
jgi:hypothetical protein